MLNQIIGVLCMMFGVAALSMEFNRLRLCTRRARATVVEVRQTDPRGIKIYSPVFEFTVDGKTIRGSGGVPGSQFRRRIEVGDVREVVYEAGKPENFRIRGNYSMLAIGALFLAAGIYTYLH